MLANIEINYDGRTKLTKFASEDKEKYNVIRDKIPQLGLRSLDEMEDQANWYTILANPRVDIDLAKEGTYLVDLDIGFEIKRFRSTYIVAQPDKSLNIQISIPNVLLWNVNKIMVEEDACTDSIQDRLDNGWRILAICPPAAQRRPDYILGKQE